MAFDFTGFERASYGTIATLNKPYYTLRGIYDYIGFNTPLPEKMALSSTDLPFAGRYITTFSPSQVAKVDSARSLYNFQFSPFVTSSPTVLSYFGRTQRGSGRTPAAYNGYNSSRRTMRPPTTSDIYSFASSYVNFQSDLEPRRIRILMGNELYYVWGRANPQYVTTNLGDYIDRSTWKVSDPAQWIDSYQANNILHKTTWLYQLSEPFTTSEPLKDSDVYSSGFGGDFGTAAQNMVIRSVNDGNFYTGFSVGVMRESLGGAGSVTINKSTGAVTTSMRDGMSFTNPGYMLSQTNFGKYPTLSVFSQDFYDHFNITGSGSAAGKELFYIGGVSYHIDGENFVKANGEIMEEPTNPDFETGVYRVNVFTDDTNNISFNIIPGMHISNIFQILASAGVPFAHPKTTKNTPIMAEVPNLPGVSAWYQTPINNQGKVVGNYRGLSKDPSYFQAIEDPSVIVITPSSDEPVDETPLEVPATFYISAGTNVYAVDQPGVNTLMTNLFEVPTTLRDAIDKYSSSLAESVKSIVVFPFNVPAYTETLAGNVVFHGEQLLGSAAIVRRSTCIIDLGYTTIESTGTFLDYKPYTQMYLYLPYCGVTNLDPRDVVGHKISIQYAVDLQTGDCKACIFRGSPSSSSQGVMIKTVPGSIGVQIPITSRDYGRIVQGLESAVSGSLDAAGFAMLGNPLLAITGATNTATALERLNESSISARGVKTSAASFALPQYPFIIRVDALPDVPADYAHNVGHLYNKYERLGDLSGLVVCKNPDLTGFALMGPEEKQLRDLLENGVYM